MKTIRYVVVLLVIIGLTVLPGCSKAEAHPSNYAQLSGLIGQSMETVLAELALPEDIQAMNPGSYLLPEKAEYAGVSFDVYLSFDPGDSDRLFRIKYQAVYQDDPQQAAADALAVAKSLSKAHGGSYFQLEQAISGMSKSELATKLSEEQRYREYNFWDISQSCGDNIKAYLEEMGASERWKQTTEYQKMQWLPHYYLECTVSRVPESEGTMVVEIEYEIDAYRPNSK